MTLFLASLGMGFGALLVGYFVFRARAQTWPPAGTPPLPVGLWLSTAIILASSVTMYAALASVRHGRYERMNWALLATLVLGLAFLGSQVMNWGLAYAARMPPDLNMFAVLFYLLTGLHGVHILGGLAPLACVTIRAFRRRYTRGQHGGVRYCAMYWHFLDGVWLVMFAVLLLGG